jgi:hypothetical protein
MVVGRVLQRTTSTSSYNPSKAQHRQTLAARSQQAAASMPSVTRLLLGYDVRIRHPLHGDLIVTMMARARVRVRVIMMVMVIVMVMVRVADRSGCQVRRK